MPGPALFLLGSPCIEQDGLRVEVDTRKAIALLAYLAVTRRRHSRDMLAALLWPEYNQSRARAALRRTLSALSVARKEGWLKADRESVGLDHEAIWVDVIRFRNLVAECRAHGHPEVDVCLTCLRPLSEAAALYRDDFLAGFGLRDSPEFDDWQFFEAQSLRRELAGVLERLTRGYGALEEWKPAINHARRWLVLDPLHEPAHRSLMQLYALAGQRAAAIRQYRECVRYLEKELRVSPLEETTELYRTLKGGGQLPAPSIANAFPVQEETAAQRAVSPLHAASPATQLASTPLVGRARELEILTGAYEAAKAEGQFVGLRGEAGIGKTRLAEEFLNYTRESGAVTFTARCYAGEADLAYGPFVEALEPVTSHQGHADRLAETPAHLLSQASRLLPTLNKSFPKLPPAPPLDTPGARSRFFEGVAQVLVAVCSAETGTPPGILFLDDLQWADAASLDLLSYLVRRLRGRPLCVLAAWRDEEVPIDHPLRILVAEAERAGTAMIVHLARLERPAVVQLVSSVVAQTGDLEQRLYDETEGHPLFLTEYLTAIQKGELDVGSGVWSPPVGVQDLLRGRLRMLSETSRQLLASAAAIGRSFDFDTVREASGRSEEETITALEELISRRLIEEVRHGVEDSSPIYDFSHGKLRAFVYEETSLARRRLLHRRVAEALASRAHRRRDTRPIAGQIAHHYRLAGQDTEAAQYFKLAGKHARALYANVEALSHFQTALALEHPDFAGLYEVIGDLQMLGGEYGAAIASYEAAAALLQGPRLTNIERKLGNVHQRRGEWDLAEDHYAASLEELGDEGPAGERAKLFADRSLLSHSQGQTKEAVGFARQALELAEAANDTRALARAHNMMGMLARSGGDQETARHHLERSLALAQALGDPDAKVAALNNLALAYGAEGKTDEATEKVEAALSLCVTYGDRHREAALRNNLADLLHAAGQQEESMAHLKKAVEIFAEIGEEGELQLEIWKLMEW